MKQMLLSACLVCAVMGFYACSKSSSTSNPVTPPIDTTKPITPLSDKYSYGYDSAFKSTGTYATMGAIQPDGKVIIANNLAIARLNKDGTLDAGFTTGKTTSGEFHALALQSDGKILLGGSFANYNGTAKPYYLRLNSDGSIDNGFKPLSVTDFSLTANSDIKSIVIRPDNKIILGGVFFFPQTVVNGTVTGPNNLARLNSDGSFDLTFTHNMKGLVTALQLFPDNGLLVGGTFLTYEYFSTPTSTVQTFGRFIKLRPDGQVDTTFRYGGTHFEVTGTYSSLPAFPQTMVLQTDGKIWIGGRFNKTSTVAVDNYNGLMRLLPNGTIDNTLPKRGFSGIVSSLCFASDRLVIGTRNDTAHANTTVNNTLIQINKDGTDNLTFKPFNFLNIGDASLVLEDADKNLILLGRFYDRIPADNNIAHGVVRLKKY